MRAAWCLLAVAAPAAAMAFPVRTTKGPVITGVRQTEAWISWETSAPQGTGDGCRFRRAAQLQLAPAANGTRLFQDPACDRIHHVHLTGLKPATRYTFDLVPRFDRNHPAHGSFTTAPSDATTPFTFVVYGDNRDAPLPLPQTRGAHEAVTAAILRMNGDAAFLLQTGDLALNLPIAGGEDRGYTEFFDVERAILSTHPLFAVVGNHETIDMKEFDALVDPSSFVHAPHPWYGSFDWGPAHFALLDSFEGPVNAGLKNDRLPGISAEQAAWLADDLEAASKRGRMIFLVSHQSPFSHVAPGTKGHGGSPDVARVIVPLMLTYRVLAVFAGHDHFYERGHEGCIDYFVVGGGGAPMYDPDPNAPGVAVARKATSYVAVTVKDGGATAVAKATSGEVLDTFRLAPADATACGEAAKQ